MAESINDRQRLAFERRAFLGGFLVSAAGLLVPRKSRIFVPAPAPVVDWVRIAMVYAIGGLAFTLARR